MKITKKLYDKMLKCCNLVAKASVMEKEIEAELETKGIDSPSSLQFISISTSSEIIISSVV